MAVVYQHKRNDTGDIFYIGIGLKESRAYDKRKRSKYWNKVVNKAGYSIDILYKDISWDEACEIEKSLICEIGRSDLGLGSLVNLTDGGEGTINMSQKSIESMRQKKIGITLTEEHKEKIKAGNIGKKRNPESIERYRESKQGDKNPAKRQEVKDKISKTLTGRKIIGRIVINKKQPNIVECPHCLFVGNNNSGAMKRWHFDNCKGKHKNE
jgi:hypothetical protein